LRLHLGFCKGCRQMEKQFQFLHQATSAWMSHKD
jgi:hypothetical protein